MTDYQEQIAAAVKRRGYRDGWTAEQFAARQAAKLVEEVGELVRELRFDDRYSWTLDLESSADWARTHFDDAGHWDYCDVGEHAARELGDVLVVVYCMADALGVDVNALALDKACADEARGVR